MSDGATSTERLREVLLELEQSQQRERQQRIQSEALLAGLRAFGEATSPDDLLHRVLETLREPLGFEDAFVLREVPGDDAFLAIISTNPRFHRTRWELQTSLARTLARGRVAIHLDTTRIGDWQQQPMDVRSSVSSALVMPLRGSEESGLLVCVHREPRAFGLAHKEIASKFQPLVSQALRDAERDAQIEAANREMRLLLDSVDQGFMTIDRDANVVGESSAIVSRWFGEIASGTPFYDVIGRHDPVLRERFDLGWEQMVRDILPIEVSLALLPARFVAKERTYSLRLRPIGDDVQWTRMLVVISDITAALKQEAAEQHMREFAKAVAHIARDRRGFEAFRSSANELVESLISGEIVDQEAQYQTLHTLKGNASIVGLASIANMAHRLESFIGDDGPQPPSVFSELEARWREFEVEVAPLLAEDDGRVSLSPEEYRWLLGELRTRKNDSGLVARVEQFRLPAVSESLFSLAAGARRVAERLGKGGIEVTVENDGLRLDSERFRPFFSNAIHVVRNAIDHGIESEEEREQAGKPRAGTLALRQWETDAEIIFEFADDGRGVDWTAIANRARELELPHETPEELRAAFFSDGLSTRSRATSTSGRGVGIGAFRRAVERLGGRVDLITEQGKGTSVRAVFPSAAAL